MTVQMKNEQKSIIKPVLKVLLLIAVPLVIAGALWLGSYIHGRVRFDEAYFSAEYQEEYSSPGPVAIALETAIKHGDTRLYSELTGLKREIMLESRPKMAYMLLVEVDESGYFHYLYFDFDTFHRQTHYIKEVNQRWVVAPEDVYFYFDSGQWLRTFMPLAMTWWAILIVIGLLKGLSYLGARTRTAYGY